MTNSQTTKAFLLSLDTKTTNLIVNNIANHYGITTDEVFNEIYDKNAECLLDYVTGSIRKTVSLFFTQFKKNIKK